MAQKTAVVNLKINNSDAQKRVGELTELMKDLKKKSQEAINTGDTKGLKEIKSQIKSINEELKEQKLFATDVDKVLKSINKAKMSDIYNSLKILRGEFDNLDRDSKEYLDTQNKIEQLESQISQHREKRRGVSEKFMSGVKNIGAVLGLGAAFNWLKGKANQCVASFNILSDSLANARKSTELTQEEVESLNTSLAKIDTRTSQTELLDLAYQAGKLGETGVQNILKFVDSADKIGVSLGEDLGGKNEAINKMGKLVDLFKIKEEFGLGEGMLKIGSAVNALGAASTANEGYIVDFTSRIGGISAKSKIAITDSMGLAATFDSLNAECEASSTVINKLIIGMFDKTSEYAKIARMDIKSFSELLRTDANEALLSVLEGLNGADVGVTSRLLGEVGETGARAAQAVSLISSNIKIVREQQALANEEFVKGTGVLDEFNIKNTTSAAEKEKQLKRLQIIIVEIGAKLSPIYNSFISGTATSAELLGRFINILWQYKGVLISVAGVFLAYNTYQKLAIFYSKANRLAIKEETLAMLAHSVSVKAGTATTASFTLGQKAMGVVTSLVSGNLKAAGVAAKAFFVSLGPVGWVITAIGAVAAGLNVVFNSIEDVTSSQKALNDITDSAKSKIAGEKTELERLLSIIENKNESDTRRLGAMKELQRLMPAGIELINQETIANGKAKKSIEEYCEALLLRSKLEAANEYLKDYEKERLKQMQEGATDLSWWQSIYAGTIDLFTRSGGSKGIELMKQNKAEFIAETNAVTEVVVEHINEYERQLKLNPGQRTVNDAMKCSKCGKSPCICIQFQEKDKQKWTLENDKEFSKQRIDLKRALLNNEIETEEEYSKLMLAAEISTLETRISGNKDKGDDLLKIKETLLDKENQQRRQEIADKKKYLTLMNVSDPLKQEEQRYEDALREYSIFNKTWNEMTADQIDIDIQLYKEHEQKMSAIYTEALIKEFYKKDELNQRSISQLKLEQSQKFATAKTFEEKKLLLAQYYSQAELRLINDTKTVDKAIKDAFQKEELAKQKEHLQSMIGSYQNLVNEFASMGTIAGKIATDEDKQKLVKIIDDLKTKLADLGLKIEVGIDLEPKTSGVDIFGMTEEQWQAAFDNLGKGKEDLKGLSGIMNGVGNAIGQSFSAVSDLMTSMEQRELKEYEKSQNKKKQSLEKRLKSGTLSQEQYNERVQEIDKQTDEKRVEIERKQAERQKMLAIFQAVINTAVAVVNALTAGPIAGPILAAVIGALGAVQIAAIASAPLPGAEDGGLLIERTQDGKKFNAQFQPEGRGVIDKPTVIVGENGTEYVVPSEGYNNPTILPILRLLESARKDGSLRNIDFTKSIAPLVEGRQNGGFINQNTNDLNKHSNYSTSSTDDIEMKSMLNELKALLGLLLKRFEKPINAISTVSGSNGSAKKTSDYEKQKSNGYM